MRVLDQGPGKAINSIFLAKEFGVTVFAADLWIKPTENARRIDEAGVSDRVFPIYAEAHALPFAENYFDAVISLDAYQYFGTDDLYLGTIAKFLKPGGHIGIMCHGLKHDIISVPEHLKPWWEWDFCCFHSLQWWRAHWAKTGHVEVETADWMEDGHALWTEWYQITAPPVQRIHCKPSSDGDAMLKFDVEKRFSFTRVVARRA